jgi:hypothetical protein
MKTLLKTTLLLAFSFLLISGSCKKEKTGTDALPPATQEGKNTFGCVINGKVFIAQTNAFSKPPVTCQYGSQSIDHYFTVSGRDNKTDPNNLFSIKIYSQKIDIQEGGYIIFKTSRIMAHMQYMIY